MKHALAIALLAALPACQAPRDALPPSSQVEWDAAQAEESEAMAALKAAEAALLAAQETPGDEDDAEAARAVLEAGRCLDAIRARLAALEAQGLEAQAEPWAGLGDVLLPGVGGVLVTALVPLLGRRGRRRYADMLKNASHGKLMTAAGDLLRALGAKHTSEATAAAAGEPEK